MNNIIEVIKAATTTQEVKEAIQSLKVKELKEIAKQLDVYTTPNMNKARLQSRIVESTIGGYLRMKAIREHGLSN